MQPTRLEQTPGHLGLEMGGSHLHPYASRHHLYDTHHRLARALIQFVMMRKDVREGGKGTEKPSGSGEAPNLQEVKCPGLALQRRGSMKETHLEIIMRRVLPVTTQEILDQSVCMIEVERILGAAGIAPTCGST